MLNRRYLRIKVMQSLYAYFLSENNNFVNGEKELNTSIERVYELYIYQLTTLLEVLFQAEKSLEDAKLKHLPTKNDLNPNFNFIDNKILNVLKNNVELKRKINTYKINWNNEHEVFKKIFLEIKASEYYKEYLKVQNPDIHVQKDFIVKILRKFVFSNGYLNQWYEDKCIYWNDDIELVNLTIIKTIKSIEADTDEYFTLFPLFKDEEDREFSKLLFRKTISNYAQYDEYLDKKLQNWEIDRIAMMDLLLMKMAICEFIEFPSIPVKATLNEYIDISKMFSTAKSSIFINGILDKVVFELTENEKIVKTGRGLIE